MKERRNRTFVKYLCIGLIWLVIALPALLQQSKTLQSIFKVEPLQGYIPPIDPVDKTISAFLEGKFQSQVEANIKKESAFSPFAIRLNNQIHKDLFNELGAGIVLGKDDYLFEKLYLEARLGVNFIGRDSIREQARKLSEIRLKLQEEKGVELLIAIALDKSLFYHEKLPDQYKFNDTITTNYHTFLSYFDLYKMPYIDFNPHFLSLKEELDHKLATRTGIHWSLYGSLMAADSVLNRVGNMLDVSVNKLDFSQTNKTTIPRKEDEDIVQSANLLAPTKGDTFSYVEYYFKPKEESEKPNILLIGDSFCWPIWNQYVPHEYWGPESKFLYYFNQIWQTNPTNIHGTQISEKQKLEFTYEADAIVLLYTPMNFNTLGNGFIDDLYRLLDLPE